MPTEEKKSKVEWAAASCIHPMTTIETSNTANCICSCRMTYLIVARPCYHHLATKSHPSDNAAVERQQLRSFGKIMTSDLDIFRTANVLIREHGEDAAPEAAQRDAMLEKGCLDGQRVVCPVGAGCHAGGTKGRTHAGAPTPLCSVCYNHQRRKWWVVGKRGGLMKNG